MHLIVINRIRIFIHLACYIYENRTFEHESIQLNCNVLILLKLFSPLLKHLYLFLVADHAYLFV